MKKAKNTIQVFGGDERIGALTNKVKDGDCFNIGDTKVECIFTPCHTSGHICYLVKTPCQDPVVFTGIYIFFFILNRLYELVDCVMCIYFYLWLMFSLDKANNHRHFDI